MTLLRDIAKELFGMFLADLKLSGAILALIALVATLIRLRGTDPYFAGGLLTIGCLAIVSIVTLIESRHR